MSELKKIHTACGNCCFCEYQNKAQVNCKMDQLEKFDDIIEAYDEDNIQFNVINGQLCIYKRSKKWFDKWGKECNLQLVKEICPSYQSVIFVEALDLLKRTVKSLNEDDTEQTYVNFIIKDEKVANEVKDYLEANPVKFSWVVNLIIDLDMTDDQCINMALCNNLRARYYLVVNAGIKIRKGTLKSITDKIMTDNLNFAVMDCGGFNIYSSPFHKFADGQPFNLEEIQCKNQQIRLSQILQ